MRGVCHKSKNRIKKLVTILFENMFREVSDNFREVSDHFRETRFQNIETSLEKFGAIMATGGLVRY